MVTVVLVLAAVALVLLIVRLVLAIWIAWSDHLAEQEASDLMPHVIQAHAVIRAMRQKLAPLEQEAARIGRCLWPN